MDTPLPPRLEAKLADFRRRVWVVKLAEGGLAAVVGLVLSYGAVFVLDRFMETPQWLRLSLLIAGAAVLGLGLPLKWHRWVWRQRSLEDAARLLRRKMPRLGDRLLGIVELARLHEGDSGRSETLVRAAIAQVDEAVKDQDFTRAVPNARHGQWSWAAGLGLAVVVATFFFVFEAARNAGERWLMPWKKVERYTFARVETLPDRLVVPYAEPFQLPVKLARKTKWKPAEGKARIDSDLPVVARLHSGLYSFNFPPRKADGSMSLALGDVRKEVKIEPKTRPELNSFAVKLRLPAYLKYQSEPVQEIRSGNIPLLKGAEASFTGAASRALASADLDGKDQKVQGEHFNTAYEPVDATKDHRFAWKDVDGLTPKDPLVLKVTAVEDEAPKISARRESQEQVVLDSEVIVFDLDASDDFGVQRVGLQWQGINGETPDKKGVAHGDELTSSGEPEKHQMGARATFCAEREGVAPQTLEIRAWAEDYLPGRKRSVSAAFVVQVLNKTDHALWLTEQFGKWLQFARESYEREQQLHQTNRELRGMSPEELDRPENRRRVTQQAAAEAANAERLGGLTQSGKQLVDQATRNPEFDAKRLESWATMLQSLKDIAGRRMPSVTDLLKQTASSAAGNGAKPSEGKAGENSPNSQMAQKSSNEKPAGSSQTSKNSNPSGPQLSQGQMPPPPAGQSPAKEGDGKPKDPAPSISDREGGFAKAEAKPADPNAPPKPPSSPSLKLPQTLLGAAPSAKKPDPEETPPQSPAQEKMGSAVKEQRDLLAEFAKVSDQLSEILASLEASTFVKRLKAASRQQMTIAADLNKGTLDAFGLEKKDAPAEPAKTGDAIAGREKDQSENVHVIQGDLEAYFQRKQDMRFKNILDQMKKTEVVRELARLSDHVSKNLSGQSISASEYWADTIDRWAEEMVAASECKSCSCAGSDSLPPEIVLMVMQALRDEMKLRDETREAETARPGLPSMDYKKRAQTLARNQEKNAMLAMQAVDSILMLPQGNQRFGKEVQLLAAVKHVMDEAGGILDTPNTGAEAIAAESEAIELLLQAKRQSPKGGGGGGSNPGGGNGTFTSTQAALNDIGPGNDAEANVRARPVGQATGRAGKEFPDEFKAGLDTYFNKLEGQNTDR